MSPDDRNLRVLVTGATGYIGSRLVPALLERGHHVVAASRSVSSTDDYPWGDRVETREFDMEDESLVEQAVAGVDAVVYLIHSMGADDFVRKDRETAQRIAGACERAGVTRLVYLSGLVPDGELSDHLRSRQEVEQVLLDSAVPATVLRAAMVVGSGSTSYELLRRLSQRVPLVTPVPAWMRRDIQPVAVEDVVELLARAVEQEPRDRHYDIGGEQVLTYPELLALFADLDGLRRVRVLVPWVPTRLVGLVCALISRMEVAEVEVLIDSLRHDMVCREDSLREDLIGEDYRFVPLEEALRRALQTDARPGTSARGDVQAAAPTDPA